MYEALSYKLFVSVCMDTDTDSRYMHTTSVSGLKLLVFEALSY